MAGIDLNRAKDQLILHEELRLKPYRDTVGKLTIGVGRNLIDVGISKAEALLLLQNDIEEKWSGVLRALPWVTKLSEVRQRVLLDMAFNLGLGGLLEFKQTLSALERGDFWLTARGMENSQWYRQTKSRAKRLVQMMETGEDYH